METKAYNVSMFKTSTKKNLNSKNIHRKSEHLCEFRVIACLVNCKTRWIKPNHIYSEHLKHKMNLGKKQCTFYYCQSTLHKPIWKLCLLIKISNLFYIRFFPIYRKTKLNYLESPPPAWGELENLSLITLSIFKLTY